VPSFSVPSICVLLVIVENVLLGQTADCPISLTREVRLANKWSNRRKPLVADLTRAQPIDGERLSELGPPDFFFLMYVLYTAK
jgi:hypothetical protein